MDWERALQQLDAARGNVFDPELVKLFAEEIRKAPPTECADVDVMIVPGGVLPWREASVGEADDDSDEAAVQDLEVLADEPMREEPA